MAKCNLCDAAIMWVRTADGASIPLALPSVPNGNAWLEPDPSDPRKKVAVIASKDRPRPDGVRAFLPHFVNCPGYAAKKRIEKSLKMADVEPAEEAS